MVLNTKVTYCHLVSSTWYLCRVQQYLPHVKVQWSLQMLWAAFYHLGGLCCSAEICPGSGCLQIFSSSPGIAAYLTPDLCSVTVLQSAAFQDYINLNLKVLAGFTNTRMLEFGFMGCCAYIEVLQSYWINDWNKMYCWYVDLTVDSSTFWWNKALVFSCEIIERNNFSCLGFILY